MTASPDTSNGNAARHNNQFPITDHTNQEAQADSFAFDESFFSVVKVQSLKIAFSMIGYADANQCAAGLLFNVGCGKDALVGHFSPQHFGTLCGDHRKLTS